MGRISFDRTEFLSFVDLISAISETLAATITEDADFSFVLNNITVGLKGRWEEEEGRE